MELTDEEAERLEQQSRENMVYFYRHELLQILGGQRAINVLSDNVRKRLTKYGLLTKRRGAPVGKRSDIGSGGACFVTPLGEEMITRCQVAPLEMNGGELSMQTLVKKRYVTYSGPEFAGGERVQLVELDFFAIKNGFKPQEFRNVARMKRDATLNLGPLKVWRVV